MTAPPSSPRLCGHVVHALLDGKILGLVCSAGDSAQTHTVTASHSGRLFSKGVCPFSPSNTASATTHMPYTRVALCGVCLMWIAFMETSTSVKLFL